MPRFKLLPVALAVASLTALADTPDTTVVTADHIDGADNAEMHATGDVVMTRNGQTVEAQWVKYFTDTSEIHAGDHTRFMQKGDVMEGGELNLRDDTRVGTLESANFCMAPRRRKLTDIYSITPATMTHGGHGDANRVYFEGEDKYRLEKARFTTCSVGDEEWYVRAPELNLDYTQDLGIAHQGTVEFKGVPILYSPYLDFSLDGARKSGLLAPTPGYSGNTGLELTLPYYWNIAPNMDDTIAPRIMTKRGVLFENQFRYLGTGYSGIIETDAIPHDQLFGHERHWYELLHHQDLAPGWHADLNLQSVSDNSYFSNYGTTQAVSSTQYLPRDARLTYTQPGLNALIDFSSYQTIQDPNAPIVAPYSREPQVVVNYNPVQSTGLRFDMTTDAVSFRNHPIGMPDGDRYHAYPSFSWPIERAWGFFNPKIGYDMTHYHLSTGENLSRDLMRSSVDSGLYFDRDMSLFGEDMVQSLEPRLYYVRIPYKNQSAFPNFDSGAADLSFAQMFSDNKFTGGDYLNDANELTAATTSRLFESDSGIELGRATIGQRFYFSSPQVSIPNTATPGTSNAKSSDILAALGAQPSKNLWLDATWDYDKQAHQTSAESLGVSYQPSPGRLINFRYRLDLQSAVSTENIKQFDISTEWPLTQRWHAVARYNWSILDHRALDALAGLEYNGGCWVLRIVGQRFVTSTTTVSTPFFLQLELNDLGALGTNPLQTLKDSIPGYTKLN